MDQISSRATFFFFLKPLPSYFRALAPLSEDHLLHGYFRLTFSVVKKRDPKSTDRSYSGVSAGTTIGRDSVTVFYPQHKSVLAFDHRVKINYLRWAREKKWVAVSRGRIKEKELPEVG